jgi:hypothetical protein
MLFDRNDRGKQTVAQEDELFDETMNQTTTPVDDIDEDSMSAAVTTMSAVEASAKLTSMPTITKESLSRIDRVKLLVCGNAFLFLLFLIVSWNFLFIPY